MSSLSLSLYADIRIASREREKQQEAEFLDVIGTKVLRVFLLAIHSHLYKRILLPPPPPSKSGLKLDCNVNIVYGNLKSENSQGYAQEPQRNCMFMNSASRDGNYQNILKEICTRIYAYGLRKPLVN